MLGPSVPLRGKRIIYILVPETTQIWGKEFPSCMISMGPGNSSFFRSAFLSDLPAQRYLLPALPLFIAYQSVCGRKSAAMLCGFNSLELTGML
jgi:hypothetical protein